MTVSSVMPAAAAVSAAEGQTTGLSECTATVKAAASKKTVRLKVGKKYKVTVKAKKARIKTNKKSVVSVKKVKLKNGKYRYVIKAKKAGRAVVKTVTDGKVKKYKVIVKKASQSSSSSSGGQTTTPSKITGLSATALSNGTIKLEWDDTGADSYVIYRSTDAFTTSEEIAVTSVNTYADKGLDAETCAYYKVCGCNSGKYGAKSDAVYAVTATASGHVHTFEALEPSYKYGYACSSCFTDVTDWDDKYACHGAYQTHYWCYTPSDTEVCTECGTYLHKHKWYYQNATYETGTDTITSSAYYMCQNCYARSLDAKNMYATTSWYTSWDFEDKDVIYVDFIATDEPEGTPIQSVTLSDTIIALEEGEVYDDLEAVITSATYTTDSTLTWSSTDETVVSVDDSGELTAVSAGYAEVTVTTANKKTDTAYIHVMENDPNISKITGVYFDGVKASGNSITLSQLTSGYYTLSVTTDNDDYGIYEVTYATSSDNYAIALRRQGGQSVSCNLSASSWRKWDRTFTEPLTGQMYADNTGTGVSNHPDRNDKIISIDSGQSWAHTENRSLAAQCR